ncbi:MAG: ParB N-terminal domain-containing protein [Planctomycetota bacterium]|nr:ParB N-terminal domain-containing protein [Planctomycetota bacterium]
MKNQSTMQVEYVSAADLKAAEYNPRTMSRAAMRALVKLLDSHGFVEPVVARREDALLIAGHQRLRANAMRQAPDERVPVVFLDGLSDLQAKALNIAMNNPAAQGRYDTAMVGRLLEEIEQGGLDAAALTGFDEDAAQDLIAACQEPEELALLEGADVQSPAEASDGVVVILEMPAATFTAIRGELDRIVATADVACHVRMGESR